MTIITIVIITIITIIMGGRGILHHQGTELNTAFAAVQSSSQLTGVDMRLKSSGLVCDLLVPMGLLVFSSLSRHVS